MAECSSWEETLHQHERLKERAATLFDGLRDLPAYGQRLWEGWFRRTFDAYNRLWKFQQEHRQTLETHGGLRRYHIGETASRIGQLYYHFYLRKGDTCYLDEAFTFYDFIRQRRYFAADAQGRTAAPPPPPPDPNADAVTQQQQLQLLQQFERQQRQQKHALALRELRYYARFAVVCLLLEKRSTLRPLVAELRELVTAIAPSCAASERAEWGLVLSEFDSFSQIDRPLTTLLTQASSADTLDDCRPHRRLRPDALRRQAALLDSSGRLPAQPLALAEAVLVGACASQPKVSELTIDVFRMLFTVEWDVGALKAAAKAGAAGAHASAAKASADGASSAGAGGDAALVHAFGMLGGAGGSSAAPPAALANPHKYLLHRTTAPQLLLVLGTALVELPPRSAVLLYLSADGLHSSPPLSSATQLVPPRELATAAAGGEAVARVEPPAPVADPPASAEPAAGVDPPTAASCAASRASLERQPPLAKLERSNSGHSSSSSSHSSHGHAASHQSHPHHGSGGNEKEDKGDNASVATLISSSSSGRSSPIASLHEGSAAVSPAQSSAAHPASDGAVMGGLRTSSATSDASAASGHHPSGSTVGGGVALAVPSASAAALRGCCLTPHDLAPFARMPLFLVVDSDNAHSFASLPSLAAGVSSHTLCLLAPGPASPYEHVARQRTLLAGGGALTLFLHEPVAALCAMCNLAPPSALACGEAEAELADACCSLTAVLVESHRTPPTVLSYLADPFLRTLLLRFVLCDAAFHCFKPTKHLLADGKLLPPRCVPEMPLEVTREGAALLSSLRRAVEALELTDCFDFSEAAKGGAPPPAPPTHAVHHASPKAKVTGWVGR